jgi:hypothetical protein
MNRLRGILMISFAISAPAWAWAEDKLVPEPAPFPREVKAGDAASKDGDPQGLPSEAELREMAERVVQNAKSAGARLADKDPGAETRRIQKDVINDLDALIRRAQNPPPQDSSSNQDQGSSTQDQPKGGPMNTPPKGGSSAGQRPKSGGSQPGMGRNDRRAQRNRPPSSRPQQGAQDDSQKESQANAKQNGAPKDPKNGANAGAGGSTVQKGPIVKVPDLYKDIWGHLPERLRQEMDLYYREQFMPRYQELLRQYYSSLAERKRTGEKE